MTFTSAVFLILFLPVYIVLAYFAKNESRNRVLCVLSMLFYCWCGIRFFILAIFMATIAFGAGWLIEDTKTIRSRRLVLIAGVSFCLGVLIYHKYFYDIANTAVKYLSVILGREITVPADPGVLPLGLSFYTFSVLSYLLDVYWGKCRAANSIINFYLYVLFFPKVIQGPIMRYADFNNQLENAEPTPGMFHAGLELFVKGLVKKVMIADQIYPLVNYSFDNIGGVGTIPAWIGIAAYLLQLYYDFSGYSDMASGLSMIGGIRLPKNFDHPYMSASVAEYWRRWHISLGMWFKEYIYTPCSKILMEKLNVKNDRDRIFVCDAISLFVVWCLTGIWHGSGFKFLAYGLWFYMFIMLERLNGYYRKKRGKIKRFSVQKDAGIQRFLSRIITILAVLFGQVLFRADSFKTAMRYWKRMIVWSKADGLLFLYPMKNYTVFILVMGLIFIFPVFDKIRPVFDKNIVLKGVYKTGLLAAFIIAFCYAMSAGYTSFLYEVF